MPKIPLPAQAAPVGRTSNLSPVSGGQIMSPSSGDRILSAALGQAQQGITAYGSAVAEFQRKQQDTENMLASAEAKNLYAQINDGLIRRMAENPGAFNDFEKWSNEADELYRKQEIQFTDRMTPEFRKNFSLSMQGTMLAQKKQRIMTGIQAKVTADYNRFQNLFKDAAQNNPQQALALLEQHRGGLISEQEYLTKKEIDLPKISQSAQMRREVEANTPGIVEKLSATDGKGNFINFTAVTPEFRQSMIRYAEAKDSQKRAEELYQFADELDSGIPISKQMIEDSFEGKTSAADLKQKQTMIQMLERKESAIQRATTAGNAKREEAQFQSDWARIVNAEFPHDVNARQKMYDEMRQYIIGTYHGKGSKMETLLKKLDEYHKLPNSPAVKVKSTTLYQDGERILDGFKAQGRFAAGEEGIFWGFNESADNKPGTVSYIEDVMKSDMTEFCKNNPQATVQQLNEYLNERIATYNKSTVAQVADMQLKEAAKRQGERKNLKRTETLKDGTRGTYNGRKVIYKNGKWEYAE
jgi:hypothetical protein